MKAILIILVIFLGIGCGSKKHKLEWKVKDGKPLCYSLLEKKINSFEFECLRDSFLNLKNCSYFDKEYFHKSLFVSQLIVFENEGDNCYEFNLERYFISKDKGEFDNAHSIDVIDILRVFKSGAMGINTHIDKSGTLCLTDGLEPKEMNYVSLLCQLPKKKVSNSETWSIDFVANEGYDYLRSNDEKVIIKLDSVEVLSEKEVAHISYDIDVIFRPKDHANSVDDEDPISSFVFLGRAIFDITNGKWLFFEGIMNKKIIGNEKREKNEYIKITEINTLSENDLKLVDLGIDEKLDFYSITSENHYIDYFSYDDDEPIEGLEEFEGLGDVDALDELTE